MLEGAKILIIDHDVTFIDQLISQLDRTRATTSWLPDNKCAMGRIENMRPDIIVLNVNIPGFDPLLILDQVKQYYPLIEVILLTEQSSINDVIPGLKRGAVDYLQKPVDMETLISKICNAYQKKLRQHEKIDRFKRFLV